MFSVFNQEHPAKEKTTRLSYNHQLLSTDEGFIFSIILGIVNINC